MQQYSTLFLVALMVVAFYFLIMRPQRKRQQEAQRLLNDLQPGARVMLGSGVFGTVVGVGEKQIVLEISDGVELTVLKQAVSRVVSDDDEDSEYVTFADEDDADVEAEAREADASANDGGSLGSAAPAEPDTHSWPAESSTAPASTESDDADGRPGDSTPTTR